MAFKKSCHLNKKCRISNEPLLKKKCKQYPKLIETTKSRYFVYNQTIASLEEQVKQGNVLLIRPKQPLKVGRIERDTTKLESLF
ncbi:DUF6363 domain-containing protein [Bacillus sp. 2205SS5-2]|uniref:DUF6363 domain-containing protein n=1 Tax=Bacillus sp. 2205SS5-2 TaxID=3109031 RepID=UPI003FA5C4A0